MWRGAQHCRARYYTDKKDLYTGAQVAPALLLAQERWNVPIPGATKLHRLEEDHGAVDLILTTDDLLRIDEGASRLKLQGARLPAAMEQTTGR